jgi:hypothetical protein
MIKNLYLHIGLPKTATSTIQLVLKNEEKLLKELGYLFPVFYLDAKPITNHSVPFISLFSNSPTKYYFNVLEGITAPEKVLEVNSDYLTQFNNMLDNFKGENLIISGEGISDLFYPGLLRLRNFFYEKFGKDLNVKVIVFVRNPVNRVQSSIQQRVKSGLILKDIYSTVIEYSDSFYEKSFTKFLNVFAKDQIDVIRFEDAIEHPDGPAGLFLNVVGIESGSIPSVKKVYENESVSKEAIILLSALNQYIPLYINGKRNPQRGKYLKGLIEKTPGTKFFISSDLKKRIWKSSEKDCKWLSDNFSIEPFIFPENSIVVDQRRWKNDTLKWIERILITNPPIIHKIIIETILCDVKENFHYYQLADIVEIFIFLKKIDIYNQIEIYVEETKIIPGLTGLIKNWFKRSVFKSVNGSFSLEFNRLRLSGCFSSKIQITPLAEDDIPKLWKRWAVKTQKFLSISSQNFGEFTYGYSKHIDKNIVVVENYIVLISSGNDPYFRIRTINDTFSDPIYMQITIESPEQTMLQVFYQTHSESFDKEKNSIHYSLERGKNESIVYFENFDFNGNFRIDIGTKAGEYKLYNITIKY